MIVTILPSSNNFHAVQYNESKVLKGDAFLLEISNFGDLSEFGYKNADELVSYLNDYSEKNDNIQKPQFHVAFSCKGNEISYQKLLDFAHQYLKEMGYGEDGQPLLVYAHNDTENNHIHIITSRVDPNGKKIDHNNERRRSQKVIEKLLGENEKLKLINCLNDIKDYNFRSVTQYRSILESLGYECYEKNSYLNIKKGGIVLSSLNISDIEKQAKINNSKFVDPNYNQLFGIFSKFRDLNSDLDGLKKDLRNKFGLELIFFGRKDSPYGYAVIDFKNKCVYEGAKIMGIKRLNKFPTPEERVDKIDQFIYQTLTSNPRITQKELNKKIRRLNAYIKNGEVIICNKKQPLSNSIKETLEINNKLAWIDLFKPQSIDEYKILLKFAGLNEKQISFPTSFKISNYDTKLIQNLKNIFSTDELEKIKLDLSNAGYQLIYFNGKNYIYSSHEKSLINLDKINLNLPNKSVNSFNLPTNIDRYSSNINNRPEQGINREWEVGSKDRWDDIDDGHQLKY